MKTAAWTDMSMEPRDVLFFRDGRPLNAGCTGHGDSWPLPSVLHSAMHAALRHCWPVPAEWEADSLLTFRSKGKGRSERKKARNTNAAMRFGALQTIGPLPSMGGDLLCPSPADLVATRDGDIARLCPTTLKGTGNLPLPLKMGLSLPANTGKEKRALPQWIKTSELAKYLMGHIPEMPQIELFDSEIRVGIAIDPDTGATVEHALFASARMRTRPSVKLCGAAKCACGDTDAIDAWLASNQGAMQLGGDGGIVMM